MCLLQTYISQMYQTILTDVMTGLWVGSFAWVADINIWEERSKPLHSQLVLSQENHVGHLLYWELVLLLLLLPGMQLQTSRYDIRRNEGLFLHFFRTLYVFIKSQIAGNIGHGHGTKSAEEVWKFCILALNLIFNRKVIDMVNNSWPI